MTQPDEISKVVRCPVCSETEPFTGTCGSNDTRALCRADRLESAPTPAEARGEDALPPLGIDTANHAGVRVRGYAVEQYATLARQLAEAKAEIERLRAMLPSPPSGQRKDFTIHEWRMAAMHYESQWGAASHHCAVIQTRAEQAEAQLAQATARLAAVEGLLREALMGWDDVIEDLELNGLHDDPHFNYRRQKEQLGAVEAKAGAALQPKEPQL